MPERSTASFGGNPVNELKELYKAKFGNYPDDREFMMEFERISYVDKPTAWRDKNDVYHEDPYYGPYGGVNELLKKKDPDLQLPPTELLLQAGNLLDLTDEEQSIFDEGPANHMYGEHGASFIPKALIAIDCQRFILLYLHAVQYREAKEELREVFRQTDKNGDGIVSREELRHLLQTQMGQPLDDEELDGFVEFADANGDGALDLQEFMSLITFAASQ